MKKSVRRRTVEWSDAATFLFLFWSLVVSSEERIYKSDSYLNKTADDPVEGMRDECGRKEADICEI